MIKLTEQQEKHIDTVKWLISDGDRASGRTYVLAVDFLDKAFNNIGREVIIFDHSNSNVGVIGLKSCIYDVFQSKNSENIYSIKLNKKSIVVSFK